MARAAKEEIEKLVPEVKQLNADEGALIELQDELKKVAARIENRDLVGIGLPIKGGLGAAVAGPEGAAYAIGAGILDIPTVKAKLAIVLNKVMKMDISEGRKTAIADQLSKIESLGEPVVDAEEDNPANDTGDKP